MYCINCGKSTPDQSRHCSECKPKIQPFTSSRDGGEGLNRLFFLISLIAGTLLRAFKTCESVEAASAGTVPAEKSTTAASESPPGPLAGLLKQWKLKRKPLIIILSVVVLAVVIAALIPRPKLTVEALFVPEQLEAGDSFIVTAKVVNTGRAAGAQTLDLNINGESFLRKEVVVEAGSEETVQFEIEGIDPAGVYRFNVDEFESDVRVLKPAEFELSRFSLESNQLIVGEETEVAVDVSNLGEVEGSYTLSLTIDGEVQQTEEITLAGESSTRVFFTVVKNEPGNYKVGLNDLSENLEVWEIVRPNNGTIFVNHLKGGSGHLKIDNGLSQDAVVVLTAPENPRKPLLSAYVRAKSKHTVRGIKNGVYHIYYSVGDDWESYSKKFTKSVHCGRFEEDFKFTSTSTTYTIWSFTLHAVEGGTASTETVPPNEFPPVQ